MTVRASRVCALRWNASEPRSQGDSLSEQQPVLCTGMHRSGTTWVGQALSAAFGLRLEHEPSNPSICPRLDHFYYASSGPEGLLGPYGFALDPKMIRRFKSALYAAPRHWPSRLTCAARSHTCLVKDPFAFFNAGQIRDRYGAEIVLCVRHPAGVVSSAMRLNWHFDFANITSQPRLRHELRPWTHLIEAQLRRDPNVLEEVSLLWKILHEWWLHSPYSPTEYTVANHAKLAAEPHEIPRLLGSREADVEALTAFLLTTRSPSGDFDTARFDDVRRDSQAHVKPWRRRLSTSQISQIQAIAGDTPGLWGFNDEDW